MHGLLHDICQSLNIEFDMNDLEMNLNMELLKDTMRALTHFYLLKMLNKNYIQAA